MTTATNTSPRPFDCAPDAPLVLHPDLLAMSGHDGYDDLIDFIADNVARGCVECGDDHDLDVAWVARDDRPLCGPCRDEAIRDAYAHDAYDRHFDR